jgi:hypothetical protein
VDISIILGTIVTTLVAIGLVTLVLSTLVHDDWRGWNLILYSICTICTIALVIGTGIRVVSTVRPF